MDGDDVQSEAETEGGNAVVAAAAESGAGR